MNVAVRFLPGVVAAALLCTMPALAAEAPDWTVVDYGEIVDLRRPTHSGEPVGLLLARLGGRPLPPPGERVADLTDHTLLAPLLEPHAAVLPDVVDRHAGGPSRPWAEVAWAWSEGEAQPAWVELLRARAYVVESDGAGRMRAFVPLAGPPGDDPASAARAAWDAAWPVLRHVVATVRENEAGGGEVVVDVHPFAHRPERTSFLLGLAPLTLRFDGDLPPVPGRPAPDLEAWATFFASGRTLEGARLEPDGTVRLLGSEPERPATILGSPITLADAAVAYRAVFHGGLAEPFMSLDRGHVPETATVNYGGRLRDTRLGEVALRCDIRFKTFSLGIDPRTGRDVREDLRARVPGFRTHLERFAADPAASGVLSQQTRLWFYPDAVDLTLSPQGDVLVLRRVRMSAASERVAAGRDGGAGADPPWTRATVEAIDRDYDALARSFPELADLDQVVRLLALFSWLKNARDEGLPVPDLDVLLAHELPAWTTPRSFPQLLTFDALPPPGVAGAVLTYARPDVHAALERLRPAGDVPLPADVRLERARTRLDPAVPQHAALLRRIDAVDRGRAPEVELDFLAHEAERLAMHRLVLATLDEDRARPLARRADAGEALRVFSVAIGGLDLGTARVVARAPRRSIGLLGSGAGTAPVPAARVETAAAPRRSAAPAGVDAQDRSVASAAPGDDRVLRDRAGQPDGDVESVVRSDVHGPGARVRAVRVPSSGGGPAFLRHERGRTVAYAVEVGERGARIRRVQASDRGWTIAGEAKPAPGVATLVVEPAARATPGAPVGLRWTAPWGAVSAYTTGRDVLWRLLVGPDLDRSGQVEAILDRLRDGVGEAPRVLVAAAPDETDPPWARDGPPRAPEERADRIARALGAIPGAPATAVAVRSDAARRWSEAPAIGKRATLVVPAAAFPEDRAAIRDAVVAAWGQEVAADLGDVRERAPLAVLVSDEPPDRLAARATAFAADAAARGTLLLVVAVGSPVRPDLPARLLGSGDLAGVGIVALPADGIDRVADVVSDLRAAIERAGRKGTVDDLTASSDTPLWYF